MSLAITSHFRSKMVSTNPSSIVELFTFNGSDISSKVTKFPAISRSTGDVVGGGITMEVENASQTFNSLETDRTQFFKTGTYDFGFSTATSGTNDTIQLFGGEFTRATFSETKAKMTFEDTLSRLKNKKIGTKNTPVSFTNTKVNPADLGWWVATSYGGLSAITSTSNPDISYENWLAWHTVFAGDNITVMANYEGESIIEALDSLQKVTDSTIYAEGDNKLYFNRWTVAASDTITVTDSFIAGKVKQTITGNSILNNVTVQTSYNPSSDTWGGEVTIQNTASVNSYGLFEAVYDDETVWFVDATAATNQAERIVFRRNQPNATYEAKTPLTFINGQLGDEVELTTEVYSLSAVPLTLQKYSINIQKSQMTLTMDEGFSRGGGRLIGFVLDDAVNGLLDQSYNGLY